MSRPLDDLLRGFFTYKLFTVALNLVSFPVLRPDRPRDFPRVSLLVPARNEARNLVTTLPALLAQGAHEVIVLDDGSDDGTGDLARSLGARVLTGAPLASGWVGKTWACQQLGRAATGDLLIFTDADVLWREGALGAVVGELLRTGADLLTVWPRQDTRTVGERLVVPLIDDVLLTLLPAPMVRLPFASASAGNGQLMAFWRAPYEKLGGHAVVRGEALEDVKFAARLKARGGRLAIALGGDFVSVRMYRRYGEAVEGIAKGLHAAHARSRPLLALTWAFHLTAYTLPLALLFVPSMRRPPLLRRPADLVLYALFERLLVNLRTGRVRPADLAEVLSTPLAPLAALPIYLRAMRSRFTWKGRTYERGVRGGPAVREDRGSGGTP